MTHFSFHPLFFILKFKILICSLLLSANSKHKPIFFFSNMAAMNHAQPLLAILPPGATWRFPQNEESELGPYRVGKWRRKRVLTKIQSPSEPTSEPSEPQLPPQLKFLIQDRWGFSPVRQISVINPSAPITEPAPFVLPLVEPRDLAQGYAIAQWLSDITPLNIPFSEFYRELLDHGPSIYSGLTIPFNPLLEHPCLQLANELPSPRDFDFDIITIHGLNGHYRDTFRNHLGEFWPTTLASELNNPHSLRGRVLSVQHQLTIGNIDQNYTLEYVAKLVIAAATAAQVGSKPILWIVHSLGGLVVKQIIELSALLKLQTIGVVFLGTPHKGSALAALFQSRLQLFGRNIESNPATRILDVSSLDAMQHRERIHNNFMESRIPYLNFIENQPCSRFLGLFRGQIVNRDSAEIIRSGPVDHFNNHAGSQIPKYSSHIVDLDHEKISKLRSDSAPFHTIPSYSGG